MTTICSFDSSRSLLETLIGNEKTYAPVDGKWSETDPRQFEEMVRNLAYGLMVKDYRNGDVIEFDGCTDEMKTFVSTACRLSHLNVIFTPSDECKAVLSAGDIDYLMTIGRTWSRKYKAAVDRTITRLVLG